MFWATKMAVSLFKNQWGNVALREGVVIALVFATWGVALLLEKVIPVGEMELGEKIVSASFHAILVDSSEGVWRVRLLLGMLALEAIYALSWNRLSKVKKGWRQWVEPVGVGIFTGWFFYVVLRMGDAM